MRNRKAIIEQYPTVFIIEEFEVEEEVEEIKEEYNPLQWVDFIYWLCDHDITKIELVSQYPVSKCFIIAHLKRELEKKQNAH